ncbi:MAG: hypothetical protein KF729_01535 [Sandaracinaceae bacterium]|nr:hypothetical protein [Sandaracinaceae bacterium]
MKVNDRMLWIEIGVRGARTDARRVERLALAITDRDLEVIARLAPIEVDDVAEAERAAVALVSAHVGAGAGVLAGTDVHEVRGALAAHMPELFGYLHYRNVDVATLRELVRRWYPDAYAARPASPTSPSHDAIDAALAELRHYRAAVFRDEPAA